MIAADSYCRVQNEEHYLGTIVNNTCFRNSAASWNEEEQMSAEVYRRVAVSLHRDGLRMPGATNTTNSGKLFRHFNAIIKFTTGAGPGMRQNLIRNPSEVPGF